MHPCETPVAGVRQGLEVSLRTAVPEDLPALEQLVRRAVLENAARDYPHQLLDEALGGPLAVEVELIRDGTYFVAMAGDGEDARIAGAGGWSRRASAHSWIHLSGEHPAAADGGGGDEGGDRSGVRPPEAADAGPPPDSDGPADLGGPAVMRAFYVDPQFARRGVGALLLSRCLSEACVAGFRRAELVATLTGEKLYERAGFRTVARLNAVLPSGSAFPVVRMVRELK